MLSHDIKEAKSIAISLFQSKANINIGYKHVLTKLLTKWIARVATCQMQVEFESSKFLELGNLKVFVLSHLF